MTDEKLFDLEIEKDLYNSDNEKVGKVYITYYNCEKDEYGYIVHGANYKNCDESNLNRAERRKRRK